jgi:metal-responsive CopG/Arc/MetJ family transcriptional regulator
MTRFSVTLDEDLVEEARTLARAQTKREVIEQALQEFVQRRRVARLADLMGSDLIDFDVPDLLEWRKSATTDA